MAKAKATSKSSPKSKAESSSKIKSKSGSKSKAKGSAKGVDNKMLPQKEGHVLFATVKKVTKTVIDLECAKGKFSTDDNNVCSALTDKDNGKRVSITRLADSSDSGHYKVAIM